MSASHRPHPAALAALLGLAVVALQALLIPLFTAPAAHIAPRDLPIVVAGPAQATGPLTARLEQARPGAFEITVVADAAAADAALRDREAYAAFVAGPAGVELHTASAAGPTVATLLTQAAAQLSEGAAVTTVDVVPSDPDDPRGSGFAAAFLPLALTAVLAGVALTVLVRRRWARLTGLLVYAAAAGPAAAAVLQFWLGLLPGDYLANAAAIALVSLATAGTVAGLGALLGAPGIGLGAVLAFLVGNALSGISSAPELLPQPWGEFGQWLPVGAGGTLLRSVAYFDGAGGGFAAWLLGGYAVVALLLVTVARSGAREPEPTRVG